MPIPAERNITAGELLEQIPKAKGDGDQKSDHRSHERTGDAPTLAERKITTIF